MKKYIIIFLITVFLCLLSNELLGQTLYLKMDRTKPREKSYSDWEYSSYTQKWRKGYLYDNYSYNDCQLWFFCKDKSLYCQTLPASNISNYPVKTLEELEAYFATLTPEQVVSYIDNLENIYIVEILPNNLIEVVKVELDIIRF